MNSFRIIKTLLGILILFAFLPVSKAQNVTCRIKGSDIVLPLTQKISELYMNKYPGSSIIVTGGGSGVGMVSLQNGSTDIAQSSRKIKLDEVIEFQESGIHYTETVIAFDALAIIINPANKVNRLTREQLEAIYTGRIKNWKELGGEDLKIVVYSRETSSGSFVFFKEHVLNRKNLDPSVRMLAANGAVVQSVSKNRGAIGYVGLAYLENEVIAAQVSYDNGYTFISPSIASVKDKTYPISRPLYYYFLDKNRESVMPFIDFILSDAGQKIVADMGYVPIK